MGAACLGPRTPSTPELRMSHGSRLPLARLFAELATIVAGVLIALAVDNFNETRRERALEVQYLDALILDVRFDSISMANTFLPALAQKDSVLQIVAPAVRGGPLGADTLAFLDALALGGRLGTKSQLVLARRTTFDELVATGNLSLLRSAALRSSLVDYHMSAELISRRMLARLPDYPMAVHAYYPAELRGDKPDEAVRAFGLRRAVEGFRSPEFEAVMNQELNYTYFAGPLLNSGARRVNEMLALLRAERP